MTRQSVIAGLRVLIVIALSIAWPAPVFAQLVPPEVSLRTDTEEVEVGDVVNITLSVMIDAASPMPGDPQLKLPSGTRMQGPFVSQQTRMVITNGHVTRRSGFDATWQVQPMTAGKLELGPATFQWNGRRVSAGNGRVVVRAAGSRPSLRGGGRGNRQDPFGGIFPFPFGFDERPAPEPQLDPQLSLDAPLDASGFLRMVVDKPRAVVGEQVTLSIYLYIQPRAYQPLDPHEPSAPDFFQRLLSSGESDARPVAVGGQRWNVQLLRRVALFPLHAGDLTVGGMSVTLVGPGFHGAGMRGGVVRTARPVTVQVVEPPLQGRPVGYALGDVGTYTLSANVEPRTVEAGGSVAVTAVLKGTGNVPSSIRLPERSGVEWLEAESREAIDASGGSIVGGRSFTYVVKISTPGKVELGELSLPYWDAKRGTYDVAIARLGAVNVTGAAPAPATSGASGGGAPSRDPFANLAKARPLAAWAPPAAPWTDARWFWLIVLGGPFSVIGIEGFVKLGRGLGARFTAARSGTAAQVKQALAEARAASKSGDGKRAASAVERAIVLSAQGATGLNIRGLLRDEVRRALVRDGLEDDAALEIEQILRECDAWRFVPGAPPASDPVARATKLTARLAKRKP